MRPLFISLAVVYTALLAATVIFYRQHPGDNWLWSAALPACLMEAFLYLASLFDNTRLRFAAWHDTLVQAPLLVSSALLPYLIFSGGTGTFHFRSFCLLVFLVAVLAFWYVVLPRRLVYDLGFLVIAAAPVITRVFARIYVSPDPHVRLDFLGHVMWIRIAVVALLVFRQWDPGPFGLWPRRAEWQIGAAWFGVSIVPLAVVAWFLGDLRFVAPDPNRAVLVACGTFFGFLWVSGLAEELFFRGVLERMLLFMTDSRVAAIVISGLVFGAVHLWFHEFPDWKRAITASMLGFACGIAYLQAGSIRASMVTHALAVATLKTFFRN